MVHWGSPCLAALKHSEYLFFALAPLLLALCGMQAPAGRAQRPAGPFKEAIVFMIGGGNYLEYESLRSGG